jgi:hypothetical protein
MAQTGYTPILIYSSSTTSNAPAVGNLTNSTLGSELAINITDGKLFYKDNANAIQVIGWKITPTTAGGTGLTSYTAGDLLYYATGTTLSKLAIGASTTVLTSNGSAPQWTAQSALSVGTALNLLSNATTGVMQIVGPAAASTRVMTIPNANFTAARTDAAQTFTGNQTFSNNVVLSGALASDVGLLKNTGQGYGVGTDRWIGSDGTTSTWFYNVPTGGNHYFAINNTNIVEITGSNAKLTTGNLIQGTAAKGINFTANTAAGGMTSQLLNWYEEGTLTVTATCDTGSITLSSNTLYYTRIGRVVTVNGQLVVSSVSSPTGNVYFTLPYSAATNSTVTLWMTNTNALTGEIPVGLINAGQTIFYVQKLNQAAGTSSGAASIFKATTVLNFQATYTV